MNKDKMSLSIKITYFLLIVLSVTQILSLSFINILICIFLGIILLFSNIEKCTIILFMLIPFFNFFNVQLGSTSLYYLFVAIFIVKYLSFKRYNISKNKLLLLIFLALVRIFCNNIEVFIKWLFLISVLVLTYNEEFFLKNIRSIIDNLSISFIISSTVGYYMLNNRIESYTYTKSYINGVTRFAGLIGDNVFFAQIALVLAAFNFIILYYKFNLKNFIIIVCIYLFAGLTVSKTAILLEAILLVLFTLMIIIKNGLNRKSCIKSIILIILAILGTILLLYYFTNNTDNVIIKNYLIRFAANDLSTGRIDIAKHYINVIYDKPQSWIVSMSDSDYSLPFYPNSKFSFPIRRSHNIYIETICCFGLFPTFIIMIWISKKIILILKKEKIIFLPLLILFMTGFLLHGHYEFHYYIIVSLCFSVFNNNFGYFLNKEHEKDEKNIYNYTTIQ